MVAASGGAKPPSSSGAGSDGRGGCSAGKGGCLAAAVLLGGLLRCPDNDNLKYSLPCMRSLGIT